MDLDPWITSESASATQITTQEYDRLHQRYTDAGYRDGITLGKTLTLQSGFDEGFGLAAPSARELGRLRGVAASLLALLTTTSGAKYLNPILEKMGGETRREEVTDECRACVRALGRLKEMEVLGEDEEANLHMRSHANGEGEGEDEGEGLVAREKREMDELGKGFEGIGGNGAKKVVEKEKCGLEECRVVLESLLERCGMKDVLPLPPRRI